MRDRFLEGELDPRRLGCASKARCPVGVGGDVGGPGALGESEDGGIAGTGGEDVEDGRLDLDVRRAVGRLGEIAQQKEVDDVSGAIVQ